MLQQEGGIELTYNEIEILTGIGLSRTQSPVLSVR